VVGVDEALSNYVKIDGVGVYRAKYVTFSGYMDGPFHSVKKVTSYTILKDPTQCILLILHLSATSSCAT